MKAPNISHYIIIGFILFGLVTIETMKLETSPHFWWDEGWTAIVARNWVEKGHYGEWVNGQAGPPGLNAAFPTTGLVALSFKVLGVGIKQGRLVGVLFMIGNFILIFFLARRLFNRKTALLTLAALCLSPLPYKFHPLGIGRQILAEPQMLFFLLAGYLCFLSALTKPGVYLPVTVFCWGIALITKAQLLPFLILSLLIPMGIVYCRGQRKTAVIFGIALLGSLLLSFGLSAVIEWVLKGHTLPRRPVKDLYRIIALVFQGHIRLEAASYCLWYAWPTLLGLGYGGWIWFKDLSSNYRIEDNLYWVRLSLFLFVAGWLLWFVLLSIGDRRYLLPPVFLGSLFVADLIGKLISKIPSQFYARIRGGRPGSLALKKKMVFGLMTIFGLISIFFLMKGPQNVSRFLFEAEDIPLFQAARFLDKETPPQALVESFDSELLFLLNRPFHYPPPDVSGTAIKKIFLRIPLTVAYDPLAADPDYLVVGPFSRLWKIYDPVLKGIHFRYLRSFGLYDIYERRR